jgi:hypothetical protein
MALDIHVTRSSNPRNLHEHLSLKARKVLDVVMSLYLISHKSLASCAEKNHSENDSADISVGFLNWTKHADYTHGCETGSECFWHQELQVIHTNFA